MEQGSKTTALYSLVFTLAFLFLPETLPRSKNGKGKKYYKKKKKHLYLTINYPFLGKSDIISPKPKLLAIINQISKY